MNNQRYVYGILARRPRLNTEPRQEIRTGWTSFLARSSLAILLFEAATGLAVTFMPFHALVEWSVIVHTLIGVATLLPVTWYCVIHWADYRHYSMSHIVLLGYVATVGLFVCSVSGLVVTWQGLVAIHTSWVWRQIHLISTFVTLGTILPHMILVLVHMRREKVVRPVRPFVWQAAGGAVAGFLVIFGLSVLYSGTQYVNELPEDYSFLYGPERPFAPSLARTSTGGAFDARSLAGSESCGTSGCHTQILEEWQPSAHRYAAMDSLFQGIQAVMAEQNGPESTRYCGGCHDPISLFSGTKNIFVEDLTGLHGYQEGISCMVCHSVRETDLKGNANYVMVQPTEYLWQWSTAGIGRVARDFLIRTYPAEHNKLSKRMFKSPEYCAACHKQFIDKEINRVGWVQLQNQYDNWAASQWNKEGDPTRTVECRECHMPLVDSQDPAAGDAADYNRSLDDGKHRSHRFIASNQFMPALLKLEGWEEHVRLTQAWLQGKVEIPEIREKWSEGPIVRVALEVPETVEPGQDIPVRVVLTSTKVGHDFPTGPLDIIQSWLQIRVTDAMGREIFSSGSVSEDHFIEPGSFLFKAEPVDQYGNIIDRHNLWEMVGVRFRRALFPGYSDAVEYLVSCPSSLAEAEEEPRRTEEPEDARHIDVPGPAQQGEYRVTAVLRYRKVDQFLLNFVYGEEAGVTAPAVNLARAEAIVQVKPPVAAALVPGAGPPAGVAGR
jgi:hypothetical protein